MVAAVFHQLGYPVTAPHGVDDLGCPAGHVSSHGTKVVIIVKERVIWEASPCPQCSFKPVTQWLLPSHRYVQLGYTINYHLLDALLEVFEGG